MTLRRETPHPVHDSPFKALHLQHGALWFHGSPSDEPLEDMGALWLADRWEDALHYAEGRRGSLHVFTVPRLIPDLSDPVIWANLHALSGDDSALKRARYRCGRLGPEEQQPLLDAARTRGYPGLQMNDRTEQQHQTLALFSRQHLRHLDQQPASALIRWNVRARQRSVAR